MKVESYAHNQYIMKKILEISRLFTGYDVDVFVVYRI